MHASSSVPDFERNKLSGRRILIVEDEMVIALGLADIVSALGAAWVTTSRVAKAVTIATTEHFDAAIVDMNLAGEKAHAVADALSIRGIPFIITSGYAAEAIAEPYRNRPRLGKPYSPEQIETALLEALAPSQR
jgi:CheY-like chemotaxis protein